MLVYFERDRGVEVIGLPAAIGRRRTWLACQKTRGPLEVSASAGDVKGRTGNLLTRQWLALGKRDARRLDLKDRSRAAKKIRTRQSRTDR